MARYEVRRIRPTVARINEIEEALQREPVEKLLEFTEQWKSHLSRYHELVVPPKPVVERMDEAAGSVGERGEDELAVRQALRAGESDAGI